MAGLGGDVRYASNRFDGAYFYPITDDWIGSLSAGGGHIFGFTGESVRINNRFFIGGDRIRGFKTAGIGPRDAITGDSLGGKLYAVGSAEISFPLGLPEEFAIRGRVFTDFGTLTQIDDDDTLGRVNDTASLRASVGVGITYVTPVGPLLLDFGVPVLKEDFDETELFRFTFGTRF